MEFLLFFSVKKKRTVTDLNEKQQTVTDRYAKKKA